MIDAVAPDDIVRARLSTASWVRQETIWLLASQERTSNLDGMTLMRQSLARADPAGENRHGVRSHLRNLESNQKKSDMRLKSFLMLFLIALIHGSCSAQSWLAIWKSYSAAFMDNQVRVIDHDANNRTTSEGQAYGMFFALVANDRSRFDGLLHWTETNLSQGDLARHLPAWLWGQNKNNQWGVLDANSASDADLWMAYTLLEAGKAWNEPRYTRIGSALAHRIATEEVVEVPNLGTMLAPGPSGFEHGGTYRLNASYVPLQLVLRLSHLAPDGPWKQVAQSVPALVTASSPHGFASDWIEFGAQPAPTIGSYDAIRVYLWAGMLDAATPHRDQLMKSLDGMENYLKTSQTPPEKVNPDGTVVDAKGPVGFSAALLPYALALGANQIRDQQMARVSADLKPQTGLFGAPAKYYDQNLALFGLGFMQRQFWFDAEGALKLSWKRN